MPYSNFFLKISPAIGKIQVVLQMPDAGRNPKWTLCKREQRTVSNILALTNPTASQPILEDNQIYSIFNPSSKIMLEVNELKRGAHRVFPHRCSKLKYASSQRRVSQKAGVSANR
jgi:hypothetical protein